MLKLTTRCDKSLRRLTKNRMKVSNNLSNSYNRNNSLTVNRNGYGSKVSKDNVSFGSMSPKPYVVNLMNFIERNGFFAEFCILDFISLVAPRIAVGLDRDRDKTGKWNLKAGSEEARRELLSGPAIFLIPIGIMTGFRHFKPATFVPRDNMTKMTELFKGLVSDKTTPEELKDTDKLTKKYAGALFDDAFSEFEFENDAQTRKGFKDKFVEFITSKVEKKGFFHRMTPEEKAAMANNQFEELIKEINNKNTKAAPLNPESLRILGLSEKEIQEAAEAAANGKKAEYKGLTVSAQNLYADFHNFVNDMIPITTNESFKSENLKKTFTEFIDKTRNARKWTRITATIMSFAAVGSFLLYLPKLYKVSNVSPAMDSAKRAQESVNGGENENQ